MSEIARKRGLSIVDISDCFKVYGLIVHCISYHLRLFSLKSVEYSIK